MDNIIEERLRKERQHLAQALRDIEAEEAAGPVKGDREAIKELLIIRIANLDRLLGNKPR